MTKPTFRDLRDLRKGDVCKPRGSGAFVVLRNVTIRSADVYISDVSHLGCYWRFGGEHLCDIDADIISVTRRGRVIWRKDEPVQNPPKRLRDADGKVTGLVWTAGVEPVPKPVKVSKPKRDHKPAFDPNFAPTGYIAIEHNRNDVTVCDRCALHRTRACASAPCVPMDRPDGRMAYFVVEPAKPKRSGRGLWPAHLTTGEILLCKTRKDARDTARCGYLVAGNPKNVAGRRRVRWEEE